jgi:hypothetical protein
MRAKRHESPFLPKRIPAIARNINDELLVYDRENHRAYNLNRVAAEVWHLCDGTKSLPEIVHVMKARSVDRVDEQVICSALDKLADAGLLSHSSVNWQRRRILKSGTMAAALAIPLITSVFVPKAEAAVSCSTLGQACNPRPCCSPLICVAGFCA